MMRGTYIYTSPGDQTRLTRRRSVFLVFFVVSMQQQIQFNLSYYVTSSFLALPLTSTTNILSQVIGGVVKLPTAKFVDLIGRAEGFAIMTTFATLGMHSSQKCTDGGSIDAPQRSGHDGSLPQCRDIRCCASKTSDPRSESPLTTR
jgi:hypothetical protein